jgi:hypothetical protein
MRRSEIDAVRRSWLPGGGSANKGAPELPLFKALDDLIASIPEQKIEAGDYVFSTQPARDTAICSFAIIKDEIDGEIAKARKAAAETGAWRAISSAMLAPSPPSCVSP